MMDLFCAVTLSNHTWSTAAYHLQPRICTNQQAGGAEPITDSPRVSYFVKLHLEHRGQYLQPRICTMQQAGGAEAMKDLFRAPKSSILSSDRFIVSSTAEEI